VKAPRATRRFQRSRWSDRRLPSVDLRLPIGVRGLEEGQSPEQAHAREGMYRRSLGCADATMASCVVLLVLPAVSGESRPALAAAALVMTVLLNKAFRLYERDEVVLNKSTLDEAPVLAQATATAVLLLWLALDGLTVVELDASDVIVLWAAMLGLLVTARLLTRELLRHAAPTERCLVAGDGAGVRAIADKIARSRFNACVVSSLQLDAGNPLLTATDREAAFRTLLVEHHADRAIIVPSAGDASRTLELVRIAKHAGVRVTVVPRLLEVVGSSVEFDNVDGLTMLGVRCFGLTRSTRLLKRTLDLVGSSLLLVATAPLMALIAVAVRLDSRGPVMFRQTRVGKDGRRFEMRKFRSMTVDADGQKDALRDRNELLGLFKISDDPRRTRVGRLLRRTSLDELPQLFNVWRGEMSLVGPRPLVVDEDALITGYFRHRLHLTPGMTGPWQILSSGRVPMNEMVAIDYMYVANWTLWTDVKILLRTVPFMLYRRGV